ncbi:TPA: hypothetical protein NNM78_002231 [Pseudomonas aeruginosa]|nr:hypothetical protein [Pseudomonas aeruginosa]
MTKSYGEMAAEVSRARSERAEIRDAAEAARGMSFKADALSSPLGVFSSKATPEALLKVLDDYDEQEARFGRLAQIVLCAAHELGLPEDASPQAVVDAIDSLQRQLAQARKKQPTAASVVAALPAKAAARTSAENVSDVLQALATLATPGTSAAPQTTLVDEIELFETAMRLQWAPSHGPLTESLFDRKPDGDYVQTTTRECLKTWLLARGLSPAGAVSEGCEQ